MNNRDIESRNVEDVEIFVFIKISKFLTKEELIMYYIRAMTKEMIMILFVSIIVW